MVGEDDLKKSVLLFGAAAMALGMGMAAPAVAQNTDSVSGDVIVVTARKREESIQEVPVSVTAFTGDQLLEQAVSDFGELALRTPGLQFSQEFGRLGDRPVIRGQASILGESGVAYFVDGVYASAGTLQSYNLADIERIEVIKGPQSALYGRNTYSGAISITTRSPTGEAGGRAFFEYGSDDQIEASVGGTIPLIEDELGIGVQIRHYERGGIFTNTWNGDEIGDQKSDSISLTAEWTPDVNFSARLRAAFQRDDDGPAPNFHQSSSMNNCYTDNGSFYGGLGRYFCGTVAPQPIAQDYDRQFTTRPGSTLDQDSYSLRMEWDVGDLTFTSVTGYTYTEDTFRADADYTAQSFEQSVFANFPLFQLFPGGPWAWGIVNGGTVDFSFENAGKSRELSQEFRLGGDGGDNWRWEIGAFYYNANSTGQNTRDIDASMQALADANAAATFAAICANAFLPCAFPVPFGSTAISYSADSSFEEITNTAFFGLVEMDVSERLTVSFEARYAEDELRASVVDRALVFGTPGATTTLIPERSATFDSFNPRFTARYTLNDDQMIYFNAAQGNKPGGYNTGVFDDTQQQFDLYGFFDEENVTQYEFGSKNTFADGQLMFNGAVFFSEVENYQLTSSVPNSAGTGTISVSTNAGDAEILGLELESVWAPDAMEGFTFAWNYSYTDAEFTAGRDQNQGLLLDALDDNLINCSTGDEFPTIAGCTSLYGDISGQRIPRVPEHMFFGQVEYRTPIGDGDWEFYGRVNGAYESSRFAQVHNEAETGSATVYGIGAGFENDQHAIRFIGENVGDEDSVLAVVRYADGNNSFRRSFFGTLRRGAYYGVSVSTRF